MDVLTDIWHYYLEQDFSHQFVSGVIAFLIIFSLLLLTGILISRTLKNSWEKKANYWHGVFQEVLVSLLFEPDLARGTKGYKDIVLKYKANKLDWIGRKTLIEEMLELHKGLKGDSGIIIEQFYRDVGLIPYQETEINRGAWWKKAYAFRVYSEFKVVEKAKLIYKYVDHPNRILRSEAQYAVVSIKGTEGLNFVPVLRSPISEWEQLVLLEKLIKFKPEDIPNVNSWLQSKNDSVVIFGTKIIHQFRLFKAQEPLLELLRHKNEDVVLHAIECIIRIEFKEACTNLRRAYPEASLKVKEKILEALSRLGDTSNLQFFKEEIENKEEFTLVMGAAQALQKLGGQALLKVLDSKELQYPQNNAIVKHALDERI